MDPLLAKCDQDAFHRMRSETVCQIPERESHLAAHNANSSRGLQRSKAHPGRRIAEPCQCEPHRAEMIRRKRKMAAQMNYCDRVGIQTPASVSNPLPDRPTS